MKVLKTALVGAAALLSTGAFASNMGFKLVKPLSAAAGNQGVNWVSLPFFNSMTGEAAICADIGASANLISLYVRATDTYLTYDCQGGFGDVIVPAKGQAIQVTVTANANWTIVGSHDNAYGVPLSAPSGNQGVNWVSLPYHTNKTVLSQLCTEIGVNANLLSVYNRTNDTYLTYDCQGGFGDEPTLTIGDAVQVTVIAGATWTPAHY